MILFSFARLADLAIESELSKPPRRKDFLGVIINIDDVRTLIEKPGRRYKGHDGRDVAATKIQSTWRRYQDRLAYLDYRKQKWAAGVIALSWVMHVKMAKVKGQLKVRRRIELDAFRERLKVMKKSMVIRFLEIDSSWSCSSFTHFFIVL